MDRAWGREKEIIHVLVGEAEGNRPFGSNRSRWENNVIIDLKATGCERMGWIHLAHDTDKWCALMSRVINLRGS
jgi:3-oxoacyl-ACP reductase-like protein